MSDTERVRDELPASETAPGVPDWYAVAVRNVAPQPITQAFFMLVYALWWAFAWPVWGTVAFGIAVGYASWVTALSIRNLRHARQFEIVTTEDGRRIGQRMSVLSAVSYGLVWIAIAALAISGHPRWILPIVAAIIALHFIPMARIFNRKIDYLLAPVALVFAVLGLCLASQPDVRWELVYAITGMGGALATGSYAGYMLYGYRALRKTAPSIATANDARGQNALSPTSH